MRRCISSGIPTPVSRTSTTTQPDSSLAARMPRAPPSGIAVTAFRISRMSASRSSKALPSTGGSASMSWRDHDGDAAPLRLVAPPGRRHLDGLGDHRGQADGAEGDLGLAGDELLEPPHGGRRLERDVPHHGQPPLRRARRLVAQHQLGIGEDGGERVVQVVGEAADRLAERPEIVVAGEPSPRVLEAPAEVPRPAPHRQDRAVDLDLRARHLARDVLDLVVIREQERGRRAPAHGPAVPTASPSPEPAPASRYPSRTPRSRASRAARRAQLRGAACATPRRTFRTLRVARARTKQRALRRPGARG